MSEVVLAESYLQRFGGIARLYGMPALRALAGSHFCVIGIGGVGAWTAEALVRSGVGEITLIDLDDICVTNTNRQIHTLTSTVGQSKTGVMATRLTEINPELVVHCIEDFIDLDNISTLLKDDQQVVVDAIDSAHVKAGIIAFCKRHKRTVVTVGSAGGKRDPRLVSSVDLSRTEYDPLLAKTRQLLRREYNFSRNQKRRFAIDAVYSSEHMVYPNADGSVCQSKSEASGLDGGVKLDCSGGFGAITMVTASFGLIAASRAVDRFLQRYAK